MLRSHSAKYIRRGITTTFTISYVMEDSDFKINLNINESRKKYSLFKIIQSKYFYIQKKKRLIIL